MNWTCYLMSVPLSFQALGTYVKNVDLDIFFINYH